MSLTSVSSPRVALVHDWLTGMRGGEKVLEVFCELFPAADIYTLIHVPGRVSPSIERHKIIPSFLQKWPSIKQRYRYFLPLMPRAIERFDFREYDLMISSSHCVAKGAIPGPKTQHVSYCHTPMRYIWDQYDDYFGPGRASWSTRLAMGLVRSTLQQWDLKTVPQVHRFIANSKNIQERIQRIYHRESDVIYPPVDYDYYSQRPAAYDKESPPPFYLIVSALAPYKRVDLAIHAFNQWKKQLLIIGDGPESSRLRALAGPNVHFAGWLDSEPLRWHYAHCQALIFPGEEDFGIVPLEAMSAGRPVIAFQKGGALETVIEGKTGLFFDHQTPDSLLQALERLDNSRWNPDDIRQHASAFSRSQCLAKLRQAFIEHLV
jgi:glycosyltransferase involved in cell wall biosynthesis